MTILLRIAATGAALLLAGAAVAQTGPTLPKMPMPPSFNDPPPKDEPAPRRTSRGARQGTASEAGTTTARPRRYVPEEFDRGEGGGYEGARPIVTEGGRTGMGMRF